MSLSQWDPFRKSVQGGLVNGQFLSGAYTVIAAGPPSLDAMGGAAAAVASLTSAPDAVAWPIGLVQNWSIAQNRNFTRFWEIGSERSFVIAGRTMGNLSLSRIMYHGPSLLRAAYAYYWDMLPDGTAMVEPMFASQALFAGEGIINPHNVQIPPGYENFFCNLASDLFSQPIGILLMMKDSNEVTYGAVYLENCYIPSSNIASDAQGTIIQENAVFDFERAVPVATTVTGLISGANPLR